jgi:hypothetical protein
MHTHNGTRFALPPDGVTADVTLLLGGIEGIDSTQDSKCGSKEAIGWIDPVRC